MRLGDCSETVFTTTSLIACSTNGISYRVHSSIKMQVTLEPEIGKHIGDL